MTEQPFRRASGGVKIYLTGEELEQHNAKIAAREAKISDPTNHVLNRVQFMALVYMLGLETAIEAALDNISDSTERAIAKARYRETQSFHRDHPLIAQLAPELNLTKEQIDTAWMTAKDIKD